LTAIPSSRYRNLAPARHPASAAFCNSLRTTERCPMSMATAAKPMKTRISRATRITVAPRWSFNGFKGNRPFFFSIRLSFLLLHSHHRLSRHIDSSAEACNKTWNDQKSIIVIDYDFQFVSWIVANSRYRGVGCNRGTKGDKAAA
jgi:hypothetical protein